MDGKRLVAAMIVGIMIVSGLGIVSGGLESASERVTNIPSGFITAYGSIPGYEPHSVSRITMTEDYTEWGCSPCAGHNPQWTAAIETVGYDTVAPAYVHVWWPTAATDPVYNYCNVDGSVTGRVNYYGIAGVPDTFVDGGDIATGQTAATYVTAFNAAAAVPSPLIINTAGSMINGLSLDGTLNIYIEASDNIASTNLRVFAYLWENNITRALWNPVSMVWDSPPYPNGETQLDWAVWDILPDGQGTPIWNTAGAVAGDWVNVQFPLTLEPEWVINEMGVSVFVQDTAAARPNVLQAAVELFNNEPPEVTLNTPNPATAEQILSGTVPITWTATDPEDEPDTGLDISIDYSANSGVSWTNVYTGTNNNVAPFTYNWVTTTVPDGIGYKVRVKALDSLGNYRFGTSVEAFSIDNTLDDEWYFQVDASGANMALNVKPVESSPKLSETATITAAGEFKLGTWQTDQTFTDKNINGEWIFNLYGKTPNPGYNPLQANLYAKIFSSSNTGTTIDTTIYDNENVGAFQVSHLFSWTDTLAGNIVNGDRILIEIWLHVTGGPYPGFSGQSLNQGFDTAAAPWTYAIWLNHAGTEVGTYRASNGNPGGYIDIQLNAPTNGLSVVEEAGGYWQQSFTTGFAPYYANISLDYKCFLMGVDTATITFYAFIDTVAGAPVRGNEVWYADVSSTTNWLSTGTIDVSSVVNADTTYYLKIAFRHDSINKNDGNYNGAFDNVRLTFDKPSPSFFFEYDYGVTQSYVAPTIGSGGGPAPAAYNIPLTGKTAGQWVFVSFPIDVTGNIQTILNDATLGDSGTTWDVAKWYDGQTKTWKSYRSSGTQTLTTINNQMGVWLHLTANGGNQMLTTGVTGLYPTSGVPVQLYAGWNLVGYPSATNRLASITLPGVADRVSIWNAATPYIVDYSDKSLVTMSQGNAYWVRVTADATWTVNV